MERYQLTFTNTFCVDVMASSEDEAWDIAESLATCDEESKINLLDGAMRDRGYVKATGVSTNYDPVWAPIDNEVARDLAWLD